MSNYTDAEGSFKEGQPSFLYHFFGDTIGHWRFTNQTRPFTLYNNVGVEDGIYEPWPIKHGDISLNMTADKKDLQVTLSAGSTLDDIYTAYPPTENLNLVIRRTHNNGSAWFENAPVSWMGHAAAVEFTGASEVEITCIPTIVSAMRPGLRRNFQLNCPLQLYGPQCTVDRAAFTTSHTVAQVFGNRIEVAATISAADRYRGGIVTWINSKGQRESLGIRHIGNNALGVYFTGKIRDLPVGTTIEISMGCNHTTQNCLMFNNILNYGGQPYIPLNNPAQSQSSIFY